MKLRLMLMVFVALTLFGAAIMAGGCEPLLECQDECDLENDQCGIGLTCFSTSTNGTICLPDECEQCFEYGDSCSHETTTKPDSETLVCSFVTCN